MESGKREGGLAELFVIHLTNSGSMVTVFWASYSPGCWYNEDQPKPLNSQVSVFS